MKNPLMKVKTTSDLIKELKNLGYQEKSRNGGSHRIFICNGRPALSIPDHNHNRDILSSGVKRNLIKLALGDSYYQK